MKRIFVTLIISFITIYLVIIGWIYLNQTSLMYFPNKEIEEVGQYDLEGTEEFFVKSENGVSIQMWYHPPVKPEMPMVVYLHGNSYNLAKRVPKFKTLLNLGYGFIAPSYEGFGKSGGSPSIKAILSDARTAIKVLKEKGYKTEDTIIVGESLGSGPAVYMANEFHFKGVLLLTPYTSTGNRAQEIYWYLPARWLIKDDFINYDKIDKINAPLLLIHGTRDDVIPHSHSEKLYKLAKEPKKIKIYEGKAHSNIDDYDIFNEMTEYFLNPAANENGKE